MVIALTIILALQIRLREFMPFAKHVQSFAKWQFALNFVNFEKRLMSGTMPGCHLKNRLGVVIYNLKHKVPVSCPMIPLGSFFLTTNKNANNSQFRAGLLS